MAASHIAAVTEIDAGTPARKAILYALAVSCDREGSWPLDRTVLAHMAGVSERTLRSNLKALGQDGLVAIDEDDRLHLKL